MTHEPPAGTGTDGHPDLERLAELDEELLDAAQTARLTGHLATCPACRDRQAQLRRTRSLLAGLPAEPIPPAVAARLETALAGAGPASATIVPAQVRRRWRAHPTAAGLAAAATVAALVVALVVGRESNGPPKPRQQAAPGPSAPGVSLADLPTATTGTNYRASNLARTVPALVNRPQTAAGVAPSPGGAAAPNTGAKSQIPAVLSRLYGSPSALADCVAGIEAGGATTRPLAIDFARYLGAPAVLVVLPGLTPGKLDAWFVGPNCTSADANLLHYEAVSPSSSPSGPAG